MNAYRPERGSFDSIWLFVAFRKKDALALALAFVNDQVSPCPCCSCAWYLTWDTVRPVASFVDASSEEFPSVDRGRIFGVVCQTLYCTRGILGQGPRRTPWLHGPNDRVNQQKRTPPLSKHKWLISCIYAAVIKDRSLILNIRNQIALGII